MMTRRWYHQFDVEVRLSRFGWWSLTSSNPRIGYPISILAKLIKSQPPGSESSPGPIEVSDEEAMEIHEIVRTLPEYQRRLVIYHYTMEWIDRRKRYLRFALSKSRYYMILDMAKTEIEKKMLTSQDYRTNLSHKSDMVG